MSRCGSGARVMVSGQAATGLRMPSPATWAGVLGGLVALSAAALLPLFILGHEQSDVVTPLVISLPTAAVGLLVARRQPRNPLGWLLLAISACLVLSEDGGLYAILDYRLGRGLPSAGGGAALSALGPGPLPVRAGDPVFPDGGSPRGGGGCCGATSRSTYSPSSRWAWRPPERSSGTASKSIPAAGSSPPTGRPAGTVPSRRRSPWCWRCSGCASSAARS